ncbi:MAG TPA: hypothetical protein VME46_20555 [Acidimicrobiales bacterium]|nr:hypothetical protein [Acidimicrobiales bacterium]
MSVLVPPARAVAALAAVMLAVPHTHPATPGAGRAAATRAGGADQLLSRALAATNSATGFDWDARQQLGRATFSFSSAVGRSSGTEEVSVVGSEQGQVSVLLFGAVAYFKGDAGGLSSIIGFAPRYAQAEQSKWVALRQAVDPTAYAAIAYEMTVATTAASLAMSGTVTELPSARLNGQRVIGLRGFSGPTSESPSGGILETLYVRAVGAPLPVELVQATPSVRLSMSFGAWGTPPSVRPPGGAVGFQRGWLSTSPGT